MIVSADAGMRGGRPVPYKHLLDEAINLAEHKPAAVLMVNRGLDKEMNVGRRPRRGLRHPARQHLDADVPGHLGRIVRAQLHPVHLRHHRQAQGRAARHRRLRRGAGRLMKHIYCGNAGETFFSTSDIGWVVGHSYIIYGPLIAGMATIMYEGTRCAPTPASGGRSARTSRSP